MKLNKKLKYVLGVAGLVGLSIIPLSIGLVSCSKHESDVIELYKQADDSIFEGKNLGRDASPFMCDFNITKKTCAIVDWIGNEPNYMTPGLEPREGLGENLNASFNNTILIPSKIVYNNDIYTVVAFRSDSKTSDNLRHFLDLSKLLSNSIQIIKFDEDFDLMLSISLGYDSLLSIGYNSLIQQNLLQVLNYSILSMDFSGSKKLKEITFNSKLNNVISDEYNSFMPNLKDCSSLTSINIPDSFTYLSNGIFSGCSSLTSVHLPKNITSIPYQGFYNCSSLTSINIPDGVTDIGSSAFQNCSNLTSINIPDSVTSIGYSAFENCSNLTSINIPNSVTFIGYKAFLGTNNLSWNIIPRNLYQNEISGGYFAGLDMNGFEIPNSVTNIGDSAFENCSSLTSINIPDGVTNIGDSAFENCSNLTSINIPEGVTSIGDSAFYDCLNLTSITISDSLTSIDAYAFAGCSSLSCITIPNSVTSIGNSAFIGTKNLSWQIIPKNIYKTKITWGLFAGLDMTGFQIPNTITSIGGEAFRYCSGLESITIPEGVTSIEDYTFYDCLSLTNIIIPNSVTSIGDRAFENCSSLTSITIPESVTKFGNSIFSLSPHPEGFKIYFHSQEQLDLFLKNNGNKQYCEVISN